MRFWNAYIDCDASDLAAILKTLMINNKTFSVQIDKMAIDFQKQFFISKIIFTSIKWVHG